MGSMTQYVNKLTPSLDIHLKVVYFSVALLFVCPAIMLFMLLTLHAICSVFLLFCSFLKHTAIVAALNSRIINRCYKRNPRVYDEKGQVN